MLEEIIAGHFSTDKKALIYLKEFKKKTCLYAI